MTLRFFSFTSLALLIGAAFFFSSSQPAFPKQGDLTGVLPATNEQPEELGLVNWLRDLDEGQARAQKTGKPLLILFQEVPGCSNCTRYGNSTLSHPLIVEAVETFFVPVCIYNNKGGKDAAALKTFGEPAWNNPVVRIADATYEDLTPRMANFNSPAQLLSGIIDVLKKQKTAVPAYVDLLLEELRARETGLETATFSMYCFWSGEATFGAIPGVIETQPGFQDGKEVVQVSFSPDLVKRADLEVLTQPKGITVCSRNSGFSGDREPKYYLAQTDYKYLPMTSLQACRANSLVGKNQSPEALLSPRQQALLEAIRQNPKRRVKNAIGATDLKKAWAEALE